MIQPGVKVEDTFHAREFALVSAGGEGLRSPLSSVQSSTLHSALSLGCGPAPQLSRIELRCCSSFRSKMVLVPLFPAKTVSQSCYMHNPMVFKQSTGSRHCTGDLEAYVMVLLGQLGGQRAPRQRDS